MTDCPEGQVPSHGCIIGPGPSLTTRLYPQDIAPARAAGKAVRPTTHLFIPKRFVHAVAVLSREVGLSSDGQLKVCLAVDPFDDLGEDPLNRLSRMVRLALLYADQVSLANAGFAYSSNIPKLRVDLGSSSSPSVERRNYEIEVTPTPLPDGLEWLADKFRPADLERTLAFLQTLEPARAEGYLVAASPVSPDDTFTYWPNDRQDVFARSGSIANADDATDFLFREIALRPFWLAAVTTTLTTPGVIPVVSAARGVSRKGLNISASVPPRDANGAKSHVSLALNFMERLPAITEVDLAEVVQIRESLTGPLVRFRAEIVKLLSEERPVAPEDFQEFADTLWFGKIQPQLVEIEELIHEDRYLLRVFDFAMSKAGALVGGGGFAAWTQTSGVTQLVTAGATVGVPLAVAARDKWLKARQMKRQQGLYYLAALSRRQR